MTVDTSQIDNAIGYIERRVETVKEELLKDQAALRELEWALDALHLQKSRVLKGEEVHA